jgi:transposase
MRGVADRQLVLVTVVSPESLIPAEHPIRRIRAIVDAVLAELDGELAVMYAQIGRPSVPPERLLKATVLMAMYSVRSERAFCERLNYDLLFKWFLDLSIDAAAFDATTFTKNRERLLEHEIADRFFAAVVRQAKLRRYMSSEHFSVDGTLLEAWASHKSFTPKDGSGAGRSAGGGRNGERDFRGERRSNATHESSTDPEALLARKSNAVAAKLSYAGHLLMENRHALIVDMEFDPGNRVCRTRDGDRHAAATAPHAAPANGCRRQGLRRQGIRHRLPRVEHHPARRAEHDQPSQRHRRSHDSSPRTRREPADTEAGRGTFRLGQDHRRRPQAQIHRPETQPGLVPDDRSRLQPAAHRGAGRPNSLTSVRQAKPTLTSHPTAAPQHTPRAAQRDARHRQLAFFRTLLEQRRGPGAA